MKLHINLRPLILMIWLALVMSSFFTAKAQPSHPTPSIMNVVQTAFFIFNGEGAQLGSFVLSRNSDEPIGIGDVNGDGLDEIIHGQRSLGVLNIRIVNQNGTLLREFSGVGSETQPVEILVGDVNGDGKDEIINVVQTAFFIFNGEGAQLGSFVLSRNSDEPIGIGDVNGDEPDEIIHGQRSLGVLNIRIVNQNGTLLREFPGVGSETQPVEILVETFADRDGDGLFDAWETSGLDINGDGTVDVDLPRFGASPMHKDLFLELDWVAGQEPTQAAIAALKAAFAAAPISAGGTPNPDGQPGIRLWVDTGGLTDPNGMEDGQVAGSCSDGIDNGGDGTADANDPDCLVGDNFGGGNAVARPIGCLDNAFYAAKNGTEAGAGAGSCSDSTDNDGDGLVDSLDPDCRNAQFAPQRKLVFRYGISGHPGDRNPCGGGQGEIGGNDFVEYNHDAGTIMHELGHTLNLRHGGDVNNNCKPNYVSVMNYDQQFGIPRAGGGTIIDYSPPRFPGGRGIAPLPTLVENNLTELVVLDATDAINRFIFVDANGNKVQTPINMSVNWNGDADPPFEAGPLTVNIDTSSTPGGFPARCTNAQTNSVLTGYDDWTNIALNFRRFGDAANAPVNPVVEREPTLDELRRAREEVITTSFIVSKTDPSLCMGVKHMVSEGANVQLFECTAGDVNKMWTINPPERHICQAGEGGLVYCIDFRAGTVDAIVTERAAFKDNQRWRYDFSNFKFHGNDPDLCLDVETQVPNSQVKVTQCEDFKRYQEFELR